MSGERKSNSLIKRLLVVTLVVAAIGTGAFFIARFLNGSWAAKDTINAAIAQIEESDEAIVELNEAVAAAVGETTPEDVTELTDKAMSAEKHLSAAEDSLAKAEELDEFLDDTQRALCGAIQDSIDARRSMISAGEAILAIDATVGTSRASLEAAVEKALSANEKSQEATQAANEYAQFLTGDTSVATQDANVALQLDNEVVALIEEAKSYVASAKEAFADADYSAYEAYLDKRGVAASAMLEADTALLSGDFQATSEKTTAYNEADAAASEAAQALPASTADIYTEPYNTLTQEQRNAYVQAASKAADADAQIRHYQGVSVSTSQDIVDTAEATTTGAKNGS